MASLVEIFNDALIQVGAEPVGNPQSTEPNAIICNVRWQGVRRAVLRAHPTNATTVRASLGADPTPPAWGYTRQYTRSSDPFDLRVLRLDDRSIDFKVEGRKILTNAGPPLNVLFVGDITDTEIWDSLLVQAGVHRLAHAIAYKVTRSRPKEADAFEAYRFFMSEHRSIDAQEGTPDPIEADAFLNARI